MPYLSSTVYLYWTKGATAFSNTTVATTAFGANNVVIATYNGGVDLDADFGRTIVDGSTIKTGTITADLIAANTITGDKLATSNVITTTAQIGDAIITNANDTVSMFAFKAVCVT